MKKRVCILFFILISIMTLNAQEFFVDHQRIEGELTSKDLYRPDFGRYDGYQMPLTKGERVHFILFSNSFSPSLVIVTPDEKKYQQTTARGDDFVTLGFKVPVSGEWVLYVVADSLARGEYYLQTAFADSASLFLNESAEFCTGMNYLLAHANAYFIFPQTVPSTRNVYRINGAIDSFINGDDPSYNASFYEGDGADEAESKFNSIAKKIDECIPKGWKKTQRTDNIGDGVIENSILWTEQVKSNYRIIRLSLTDFSANDSDEDYLGNYSVDLLIMKY